MDWQNIVAILLVIVGVIGSILPMLPGTPLVFGGLLLAAWHDNFVHVSIASMVIIGVLALLAWLVDFFASIVTAKKFGASKQAMWGAGIGGLVGILGGVPGLIIGPAIGAVIGELIAQNNAAKTLEKSGANTNNGEKPAGTDGAKVTVVGVAAGLGFVLAMVIKLVLIFAMLGIFAYAYYY
jgi:uncharacterized protein